MVKIITDREWEIIRKKVKGHKLSQNESNILSKAVRPKLKEISRINSEELLSRLEYNQRAVSIENKIRKIVLKNSSNVDSIILCGSVIQNNYEDYKDIDVIIATKKSMKPEKKREILGKIVKDGRVAGLDLDVQIYSKKSILSQYPRSPSLIYQLKDSKIIYGRLKIQNKINLSKVDLKMKLDWSEGLNANSEAKEIYLAIRNAVLVLLLMNKKVDNMELKGNLRSVLGDDLINRLKENKASKPEKKLALGYLNLMIGHLESELKNSKWEKIEIENP